MPIDIEENVKPALLQLAGVKITVILFMLFILISSDIFISKVLGNISGAVNGRTVTSYGTIVQGIFLVLIYILGIHLVDSDIL